MKLSERLYLRTRDLWEQSASKPFVTGMAKGTLDRSLFRRYMLQDYLYLQDYIRLLEHIFDIAEDENIRRFLKKIIDGTVYETEHVHLVNMKNLGITGDEIAQCVRFPVITDYVNFMRICVEEHGLAGGITSLLQCSWVYAYIGERCSDMYSAEIASSEYRSWFEAYSCGSYLETNQLWIDLLDELCADIEDETAEEMCRIFERCALYENELWDALME